MNLLAGFFIVLGLFGVGKAISGQAFASRPPVPAPITPITPEDKVAEFISESKVPFTMEPEGGIGIVKTPAMKMPTVTPTATYEPGQPSTVYEVQAAQPVVSGEPTGRISTHGFTPVPFATIIKEDSRYVEYYI